MKQFVTSFTVQDLELSIKRVELAEKDHSPAVPNRRERYRCSLLLSSDTPLVNCAGEVVHLNHFLVHFFNTTFKEYFVD